MRQIFSVVLATALVFGGALFMAGYFAGLEVPEREPDETTSGPHSMSGPIILGELWHCPEVERIMAGPMPGILSGPFPGRFDASPEELAEIDETFEWEGAYLDDLTVRTSSSAKGRDVTCVYRQTGRPWGRVKLNLAPGLQAEIEHDRRVEGGWRGLPGLDCGGYGFSCRGSTRECGFYVRRAEIKTGENSTEGEETCLWPPLEAPEVPVERGGRATGGGD